MNEPLTGMTIGLAFAAVIVGVLWLLLPFAVFAINSKITAACADLRRIRASLERAEPNS
jgi:ABC-type spermidine/putrescine transport system permease subunit I